MVKHSFAKKEIEFRKIKSIDYALLYEDILNSSLVRNSPEHLDSLVALYDSELSTILDRHPPLKKTLYHNPTSCTVVYRRHN